MPWTMKVVFSSIRIDIVSTSAGLPAPRSENELGLRPRENGRASRALSLDLRHRSSGGLVHRHRPVAVLDPVALQDLRALLFPRTGDAEDRDRLRGVLAELEAGLDHTAGDDVHPGVRDDRHHHRDLLDAVLEQHLLGQAAGLGYRRVAADLRVV